MKQISILGCGWLGLPLAKSLLKKNHLVKGSTTSFNKLEILKNAGVQPFTIALEMGMVFGEFSEFIHNSETLIIDIPPGLRNKNIIIDEDYIKSFVQKIENILPFIENSTVKKVLFISSTSVYDDFENVAQQVFETDVLTPKTNVADQLLSVEHLLLNNKNFETTIIRFGGLIGEDRHPIHFLAGRKNIESPDAFINFIHQKDCIGIIEKIIENNIWNEIFNGVAPQHRSRAAYYTQKAKELNLEIPEFDASKPSTGKIVSSEKVQELLGYQFQESI